MNDIYADAEDIQQPDLGREGMFWARLGWVWNDVLLRNGDGIMNIQGDIVLKALRFGVGRSQYIEQVDPSLY